MHIYACVCVCVCVCVYIFAKTRGGVCAFCLFAVVCVCECVASFFFRGWGIGGWGERRDSDLLPSNTEFLAFRYASFYSLAH